VRSGYLRQRVTIQARTLVSDGHDGFIETWAAVKARVPARVRPLTGRDLETAKQVNPEISHEVSLRYWQGYWDDLKGGRARLTYHPTNTATQDRVFEIIGPPIDVDERHAEVRMFTKEAA
jgi:SPP1 family predicted phage head-tail adaptor